MIFNKHSLLLLSAVGVLACGAGAARGDVITYTNTTIGSGTLDGMSFTDALVTVSITGNTADITSSGSPAVYELDNPLMVSVAGVGSDTFTGVGTVVDNQGQGNVHALGMGTGGANGPAVLGEFNAVFATYNLETAFGPVTGPGFYGGGATENGSFRLSSIGPVTFIAVDDSTATAPEPSSLFLLGIGMAALVGLGAKKTLS